MLWKKHGEKLLAALFLAALLAAAYYVGGGGALSRGWALRPVETPPAPVGAASASPAPPASETPAAPEPDASPTEGLTSEDAAAPEGAPSPSGTPEEGAQPAETAPAGGGDAYLTESVPEGKPEPVKPQDASVGTEAYSCTLSVSCAALLDNPDLLEEDKRELVPEDGWLLAPATVVFYEGESVFDVLRRTMEQRGIHMEFVGTPVYNSAYIEGIGNLYEFDAGELSGWMYRVNGWFPNYGCSRYQVRDGDEIEWVYTCDLGRDVGGYIAEGGQKDA